MVPTSPIVIVILLLTACGGAPVRRDGAAGDPRLDGEWEIVLTISPSPFGREIRGTTGRAQGTVAFVPNRAGTAIPGFGGVPQELGTHDLGLAELLPEFSDGRALPMAAGSGAGDSVHLVLQTGSGQPVVLHGTWRENEVTGEWMAHRRAGIDQEGRFTLRRPS